MRTIARTLFVLACLALVWWLATAPWAWLLIVPLLLLVLVVCILLGLGLRIEVVQDDEEPEPEWLDIEPGQCVAGGPVSAGCYIVAACGCRTNMGQP